MPENWKPQFPGLEGGTHAYVGSKNANASGARSYIHKGTGFMIGTKEWEPQRTNNFELVIEGLDQLVYADATEPVNPMNAAERLMLSVQGFTAPTLELGKITTQYANNSINWAGKPEFQGSSIVINDYIGARVEQLLAAWFRCAYDFQSECIGWAVNYKKTAYLIEYAPNGSEARVWKLDGCWLGSFQLGEWSQDGNNQRQLTANLIYDRIIPDHNILTNESGNTYNWEKA